MKYKDNYKDYDMIHNPKPRRKQFTNHEIHRSSKKKSHTLNHKDTMKMRRELIELEGEY